MTDTSFYGLFAAFVLLSIVLIYLFYRHGKKYYQDLYEANANEIKANDEKIELLVFINKCQTMIDCYKLFNKELMKALEQNGIDKTEFEKQEKELTQVLQKLYTSLNLQ